MTRIPIANRRACETFVIEWSGAAYDISVGLLVDGSPIEVFVSCRTAGRDLQALARDAGILISLAMQHGAGTAILRAAVTRGDKDEPTSLVGAVLDALAK